MHHIIVELKDTSQVIPLIVMNLELKYPRANPESVHNVAVVAKTMKQVPCESMSV